MDDQYQDGPEDDEECGPCSRGGGLLLLALGAGIAFMGADLLTGGALTRLLTGGLAGGLRGAAAVAGTAAGHNEGSEPGEAGEAEADADSAAG